MKCPTCSVDLEVRLAGDVGVDECSACGGAWFEEDELRQAKDEWDGDLQWMDFELWKELDSLAVEIQGRACPSCGKGLVTVQYADTGVQVDCCAECRGLWLEDGEFAAILDALEAELLNKPFSRYIRESLVEAKEILTGPESIAAEWRDFKTVVRLMQYRLLVENPKVAKVIADAQASSPF